MSTVEGEKQDYAFLPQIIQEIIHGIALITGDAFFQSLTQYLCDVLDVDCAFVGELAKDSPNSVTTIAVCIEGQIANNFEYPLQNTPCQNVIGQGLCYYPHTVQRLYPQDLILSEMEAESYMGIPLSASNGTPLGLLAVIDRQPLRHEEVVKAALQICAIRAAAELERRQNDLLLRENEAKIQTLLQAAPIAIVVADQNGRIIFVNDETTVIFGYGQQELVGRRVEMLLPQNLRERHTQHRAKYMTDLRRRPMGLGLELVGQRKDGSEVPVEVGLGAVETRDGVWITSFISDISERVEIEEARRRSEANLAEAQRIARLGNWVWDIETNELDWSDEIYRIFGLAPQEFGATYEAFLRSVHPDDREYVQAAVNRALNGEEAYEIEHRIRRPDGQERIVHERAEVAFDANGRALRMAGTVQDVTESRQAESQMRLLATALEQTTDSAIITSLDGTIEYVNTAFEKITGYTRREALGNTPRLLKSGKHSRQFYKKLWQTLLDGQPFQAVFTNRKKSGELYYEDRTIFPLKDSQDRILCFVSTGRDITQRRKAKKALEKSEALYRTLAANLPDGDVYLFDAQARFLLADGMEMRRLGLPREFFIGKTVSETLAMSAAILEQIDAEFLRELAVETEELFWQALAGHETSREFLVADQAYHMRVLPLRDSRHNVYAGIALTQNITERKQLEQRLAAIHQLGQELTLLHDEAAIVRRVLETAASALRFRRISCALVNEENHTLAFHYCLPENGEVKTCNDYLLSLDGERGISVAVVHSKQPIYVANLAHDPRHFSFSGKAARGSALCVPMAVKERVLGVLNTESDEPDSFTPADRQLLQTLADHTAVALENARLYTAQQEQYRRLRESQAQLIQAEKMAALGRLVASIAHEINNPLQAIQGYIGLTRENLEGLDRQQQLERYLNIVDSEIDRTTTLVRRLRDFYQPAQEEFQLIDVHQELFSVLDLAGKQLEQANIVVERQWLADLPLIRANPAHLKQVFLNLILNAIDAMPDGGALRIGTDLDQMPSLLVSADNSEELLAVRITVSDTGVGMSEAVLSRLFEPFFTTREHGSGLGLSVSYSIIEAHSGQITVTSQVGKGTTFTILLPVFS